MYTRKITKLVTSLVVVSVGIFFTLNCSEKDKIISKEKASNSKVLNKDTSSTVKYPNNIISKQATTEKTDLVFIGTYTSGSSTGIYVYKMDTLTGSLSYICSSPNTSNPSYLAIHPNKKWLYAVNENSSGTISAFSFDSVQNKIAFINSTSSQGNGPCYISIDNTGKFVLVANYNSGNVTVCPINSNGSLGAASSTDQHAGTSPHAHMIIQAANNFVYNTDLGDDKIFIYSLDTLNGHITSTGNDVSTISGAGPRHIAFHPTQPWIYVVCELKGLIEEYSMNNSSGVLSYIDTISTLPSGSSSPSSADIHITPDGKYLYASNRGTYNNIAMYTINQSTGELSLIGYQAVGGTNPRGFVIDPSGKFLLVACQDNSKIITFKINSSNGKLVTTGIQITVPNPVCLKFLEVYKEKVNSGIRTINF